MVPALRFGPGFDDPDGLFRHRCDRRGGKLPTPISRGPGIGNRGQISRLRATVRVSEGHMWRERRDDGERKTGALRVVHGLWVNTVQAVGGRVGQLVERGGRPLRRWSGERQAGRETSENLTKVRPLDRVFEPKKSTPVDYSGRLRCCYPCRTMRRKKL